MAVAGVTVQAQPGSSEAAIYTVPAGRTLFVRGIICANTTGADATARVSLSPGGGNSVAAVNRVIPDVPVKAYDRITDTVGYVLPTGAKIFAAASASSTVSVTITGVLV